MFHILISRSWQLSNHGIDKSYPQNIFYSFLIDIANTEKEKEAIKFGTGTSSIVPAVMITAIYSV